MAEGAHVAACPAGGIQRPGPRAGPEGFPPELVVLEGDVCAPGEAQRIIDAVDERFGRLDILVNHGAGGRLVGTILDVSRAVFDEAVAGDVWSVVALSTAAIPLMAKSGGGSIVNITSIGRVGLKGRPLRAANAASVSTLTVSMALDHGEQGIRVNALLLGPTLTPELMTRTEQVEQFQREAVLGQLASPEDVAAAALFLASDEARRITGALLPVDAGRSLPTF